MAHSSPEPKSRIGIFRWIVSGIVLLVLGIAWTLLYIGEVRAVEVTSGSMEPTIATGDRLFVQMLGNQPPKFGQIVVLKSPDDDGPDLVKRLVGLPGDKIELRSGALYRNGVAVPTPNTGINNSMGIADQTITLGPDKYFLMGDNRSKSHDSTEFGPVDRSLIHSYVLYRYSPWAARGVVE